MNVEGMPETIHTPGGVGLTAGWRPARQTVVRLTIADRWTFESQC